MSYTEAHYSSYLLPESVPCLHYQVQDKTMLRWCTYLGSAHVSVATRDLCKNFFLDFNDNLCMLTKFPAVHKLPSC